MGFTSPPALMILTPAVHLSVCFCDKFVIHSMTLVPDRFGWLTILRQPISPYVFDCLVYSLGSTSQG